MSMCFLQRSHYHWSASATFAAASFFIPPPAPSGRYPDWGWGWRACSSPLADPLTVRTLSKKVKKPRRSFAVIACHVLDRLFSSPRKAVWSPTWPTSWELQIIVKNGVNRFSRHVMSLSEFHDTLSMIILHFGGDPGDDHHRGAISLICCCRRPFSYFAFW